MDGEDLSVVARNLWAIIRRDDNRPEPSVNAWSKRHGLEQTSVRKVLTGERDPSLSWIEKAAAALRAHGTPAQAWHLLLPDFNPRAPQMNPIGAPLDELEEQLLRFFGELGPDERAEALDEVRRRAERAIGARVLAAQHDRRATDTERRSDPHPALDKRGLRGGEKWSPGLPIRTERKRRQS